MQKNKKKERVEIIKIISIFFATSCICLTHHSNSELQFGQTATPTGIEVPQAGQAVISAPASPPPSPSPSGAGSSSGGAASPSGSGAGVSSPASMGASSSGNSSAANSSSGSSSSGSSASSDGRPSSMGLVSVRTRAVESPTDQKMLRGSAPAMPLMTRYSTALRPSPLVGPLRLAALPVVALLPPASSCATLRHRLRSRSPQ